VERGAIDGPLSGRDVARLLYATGTPLGRTSSEGPVVREICLRNFFHALSMGNFPELLAALRLPIGKYINPEVETVANAWWPFSDEGLCPRVHLQRLEWPATFSPDDPTAMCSSVDASTSSTTWDLLPAGAPLPAMEPDRYTAASTGPQPGSPACPECSLYLHAAAGKLTLAIELNRDYSSLTTFTNPALLISDGTTVARIPRLHELTGTAVWTAGSAFSIRDLHAPAELNLAAPLRAMLMVEIGEPNRVAVTDYSSLRVTVP
jgi:hypothetical protein